MQTTRAFPDGRIAKPCVCQPKVKDSDNGNSRATLIISLADGRTEEKSLERVINFNLYKVLIGLN
jgi:hypothetical protein